MTKRFWIVLMCFAVSAVFGSMAFADTAREIMERLQKCPTCPMAKDFPIAEFNASEFLDANVDEDRIKSNRPITKDHGVVTVAMIRESVRTSDCRWLHHLTPSDAATQVKPIYRGATLLGNYRVVWRERYQADPEFQQTNWVKSGAKSQSPRSIISAALHGDASMVRGKDAVCVRAGYYVYTVPDQNYSSWRYTQTVGAYERVEAARETWSRD